jgi:hypothetical protein
MDLAAVMESVAVIPIGKEALTVAAEPLLMERA